MRVVNGMCQSDAPWHGALAVSGDGAAPGAPWLLLNLSGAAASRLECDQRLAGMAAGAGLPAQPVLLTDAQIDHVAGLISLRGGACIELYATPSVFEDLSTTMPVLPELQRHCGVNWHMVPVAGDQRVADFEVRGQQSLQFTAFDAGQAPADSVGDPRCPPTGHCIAVGVRDKASGRRAVFTRGLGAMALSIAGVLDGVQCLVVDPGKAVNTAAGTDLIAWMASLPLPRKVLLGPGAPELARWGIEPGVDGLEIVL